MNWQKLLAAALFGAVIGLIRGAQEAPRIGVTLSETYFMTSQVWLCLNQEAGQSDGLNRALALWGRTSRARANEGASRMVEGTRQQVAAGQPLSCPAEIDELLDSLRE